MSAHLFSARLRLIAATVLAVGFCAAAADPLPVAPPPREAKPTQAKIDPALLVGKWRIVHQNFRDIPPGEISINEYTADGRFRYELQYPGEPPRIVTGVYILEGNTLRLEDDVARPPIPRSRTTTIEVLTKDRMVSSTGADLGLQRTVRRRLPDE